MQILYIATMTWRSRSIFHHYVQNLMINNWIISISLYYKCGIWNRFLMQNASIIRKYHVSNRRRTLEKVNFWNWIFICKKPKNQQKNKNNSFPSIILKLCNYFLLQTFFGNLCLFIISKTCLIFFLFPPTFEHFNKLVTLSVLWCGVTNVFYSNEFRDLVLCVSGSNGLSSLIVEFNILQDFWPYFDKIEIECSCFMRNKHIIVYTQQLFYCEEHFLWHFHHKRKRKTLKHRFIISCCILTTHIILISLFKNPLRFSMWAATSDNHKCLRVKFKKKKKWTESDRFLFFLTK